jgi:hypothetical protein
MQLGDKGIINAMFNKEDIERQTSNNNALDKLIIDYSCAILG